MTLFDQQPFGPVPARRPNLIPHDPELEGLGVDYPDLRLEVVAPVPAELADADATPPRRHLGLRVVAWLVLLPLLAQLVIGTVMVITGEQFAGDGMRTPALISIGLVLAAIAGAWVLFVRSRR